MTIDFVDDNGTQWIMAACGHHVGGGVKTGDKIDLCPNCRFLIRFKAIDIVYPERLSSHVVKGTRNNSIVTQDIIQEANND